MKRCKICGAVFCPTNNNQKYCSNECSRIVINEKHRKRYMQKKTQTKKTITKVCTVCGSLFVLTHSAQTICSKECVKKKKALIAKLHYQNNKTTLLKKSAEYRELQRSQRQGGKQCILCGAETRGFVCKDPECKKIYHQVYSWTRNRMKNDIRASGKKYINPPEKIQAIKEKYKKGVSFEHIKSMLE